MGLGRGQLHVVAAPSRDAAIFTPSISGRGYRALEGPQGLWVCALCVTQHNLVLAWFCHLSCWTRFSSA